MSWQDELAGYMAGASKTVVLGAGSVLCGDDAAGMLVVELIQKAIGENTDCLLPLAGSTAPENFSGVIRDYQPDLVFLIDAAYMHGTVGEIRFLDPAQIKGIDFSTHMLPLSILADYLSRETKAQVALIGIQPASTDFDTPPCAAVQTSCQVLAERIVFLALPGREEMN